jgi:hypothetical protein
MTIDDEIFFAWIDGELPGPEAQRVAEAVAADPVLARRAEQHRALAQQLRGAFDPLIEAPVPDRFAVPPASLAEARERREARSLPRQAQWAAMAATLAVGIVAGSLIAPGGSGPVSVERDRLVASGELDQALSTRLASAPQAQGARIGLTYRNRDGALCRSFSDGGARGLACREDDSWQIRGLFAGESGGDYRMAAGDDPRLAAMIDDSIAGEPLDAAGEAAAKAAGWR